MYTAAPVWIVRGRGEGTGDRGASFTLSGQIRREDFRHDFEKYARNANSVSRNGPARIRENSTARTDLTWSVYRTALPVVDQIVRPECREHDSRRMFSSFSSSVKYTTKITRWYKRASYYRIYPKHIEIPIQIWYFGDRHRIVYNNFIVLKMVRWKKTLVVPRQFKQRTWQNEAWKRLKCTMCY